MENGTEDTPSVIFPLYADLSLDERLLGQMQDCTKLYSSSTLPLQ